MKYKKVLGITILVLLLISNIVTIGRAYPLIGISATMRLLTYFPISIGLIKALSRK